MAQVKCPKCTTLNEAGQPRCGRCGAALPNISFNAKERTPQHPPPPPEDGTLFRRGQVVNNRYTVLDLIGRGGMGRIYKVHDNMLGEDLALKTLLPQFISDKTVKDRFLNEARITRKLAHPNIVRVHDIDAAGPGIFISMEYVQGESVRAILEHLPSGERMPVRQALHIIEQLCLALEYAHAHTIHRDIKPENIMITQENRVKLMDFGISKLMDNRFATSASVVMGTPYYMSPEQLRNSRDVDARADLYSMGVVLYELLTGDMPTGVPKPASQMLKDVPPALDVIIARCVDPDRNKRFNSAAELRGALRPIIELLDAGRDPAKTLSKKHVVRRSPKITRRQVVAFLGMTLVAAATVTGWLAVEQWVLPEPVPDTGPLHALTGPEAERFEQLGEMIRALREKAEDLRETVQHRELLLAAETLADRAATEARAANVVAIQTAESAAQYFMAGMDAPEDMVFVPAGNVTLDGVTIHVPGFHIDVTETTIGQFREFCRQVEGGWRFPEELRDIAEIYPEYPVSFVAFYDAQAYAAWKDKDLPTRAQWTRAACGDISSPSMYPWGNDWAPGAANIHSPHSMPVGSHARDQTWSGCHDMAGNVREWTRTMPSPAAPDTVPSFGDALLVCGGGFTGPKPLGAAEAVPFETRAGDLGFRCVREIPVTPEAVAALLKRLQ